MDKQIMKIQGHLVKSMVFPVVMYGCESWTIKKAEHWRIDALNYGVREDSLRIPWTERRSNQPILKEISPRCSLEGLMLKLKLQYFGHLTRRADSSEKTLRAGGEGDDRGWDDWMASPTQYTWVWVNSRSWWWTGRPGVLRFMGSQRDKTEQLNWSEDKQFSSENIWLINMKPKILFFLSFRVQLSDLQEISNDIRKLKKATCWWTEILCIITNSS